jgi:hypothetical protein
MVSKSIPTGDEYYTYDAYIEDFKYAMKSIDLHRYLQTTDRQIISRKLHQFLPKKLTKKERTHKLKEIGESFTGYCIELWLWNKGYSLNGLMGNSFTIEPQCNNGTHRIDFKLKIDGNSKITCIIDAKNWSRFNKKDAVNYMNNHIKPFSSYTANYKLMFVNKRVIPHTKQILQQNNVIPIPVSEHITDKQYFRDFMMLDLCMEDCISYLDTIIPLNDVSRDVSKMNNPDAIKYDIELGKPVKFLKYKWDISQGYFDKLKRELNKSGVKQPRRNTKVFTRLKQYNEYFKRN